MSEDYGKYNNSVQKLALHYGPENDTRIERYSWTIDLDSRTCISVWPSNQEGLPLGVTIECFDASGGQSSETQVGLFSDWSFLVPVIDNLLKGQEVKPNLDKMLVDPRSVQVGDLIEDLGFTVEKIKTLMTAGRGLVTILSDGERSLPVELGYEFLVTRGWEGHSEFLDSEMVRKNIGESIKARMDYDGEPDVEALLRWADTFHVDLRSCDLTDSEFAWIEYQAGKQAKREAAVPSKFGDASIVW